MRGYIDYVKFFRNKIPDEIVNKLKSYYKEAEQSQIDSWYELIRVLKSTSSLKDLPEDLIIAIEYSLPTDGMALDLMFIGSIGEKEYAFILESKQWGDDYITGAQFSEFRGNDVLLYPQVQVHHHEISFKNYFNIGTRVAKVYPYVYLENATQIGVNKVLQNPDPNSKRIPVITDMNVFINKIIELGLNPGITGIADLYDAKYFPSKDILTAMSSLIEKEEPFVLTESQEKKVQEIYSAVNSGNKIIHISGPAGSGKTAILLNLFVRLLKKAPETGYTPLFAPGGQNTSVYRTLYPQISDMFT